MQSIVRIACNKNILVFGESAHNDGATLALKAKVIPQLVNRCGFNAIAFEASYYDFAELNRITAPSDKYNRAKFLSSIGGMWNRWAEFSPMADWISTQTPNKLHIFGMDVQIGSRDAFYQMGAMKDELAEFVEVGSRERCVAVIDPKTNWRVPTSELKPELELCLSQIVAKLEPMNDLRSRHLRAIASAYRRANQGELVNGQNPHGVRDQAMADNFDNFRNALPRGSKIIVWTANSHAAYKELQGAPSLGQILKARYGPIVFNIGLTAAGGQIGTLPNWVKELPPPKIGSIESYFEQSKEVTILTHRQLRQIGIAESRIMNNHEVVSEDWSQLFDSIAILRFERPTSPVVPLSQ